MISTARTVRRLSRLYDAIAGRVHFEGYKASSFRLMKRLWMMIPVKVRFYRAFFLSSI
jgi:hypothetical protein